MLRGRRTRVTPLEQCVRVMTTMQPNQLGPPVKDSLPTGEKIPAALGVRKVGLPRIAGLRERLA